MSKPTSPVSLFSHLSVMLGEFGELLPNAFRQRSGDGIKEPFPALDLIHKLHDIVCHELLAPDYDNKTKDTLEQIRTDLHRMVYATEEAVVICVTPNFIGFHRIISGYHENLYRSTQLLMSFIRKHLDSRIEDMVFGAEKESGRPTPICITPYKPWDTMRLEEKPPHAEIKCASHQSGYPHQCGNPNKEPWPRCCREASVSISKQMEAHYLRQKN